jgi:ATP-binding cassette subfamily B protein
MHADVIYVLERGKIIETGNHNYLLQQKGLYYAMWRQQVGERRERIPMESVMEEEDGVDEIILNDKNQA